MELFKLCNSKGLYIYTYIYIYIYILIFYGGKITEAAVGNDNRSSHVVVMLVIKYCTSEHRTLVTDSFYNNLGLAYCLVENKTHLVECLRQKVNRCALGEIVGKGSNTVTAVANWTGKRNVRFIAMRHGLMMIDTDRNRKTIKPSAILFYNQHKKGIDISVKMDS